MRFPSYEVPNFEFADAQGRFFSPKASDSCSAGFASPPGTPPRYEGPPASAFGRVCGKCGGDGKVSEWRNRTASEVRTGAVL